LTNICDVKIDNNYGQIVLQVDNTPPTVQILSVNGSPQACGIISFGATNNDHIDVNFRVFDQRGHLKSYSFDTLYGHNQYVNPVPAWATDSYNNHSTGSPSWQGNLSYNIQYTGNIQTPDVMKSCAYQLRPHASKRTTDGYSLIFPWVEDTWHLSIQRP
jgi:signal peptidase I